MALLETLVDEFDGTTLNNALWTPLHQTTAASHTVSGGNLTLNIANTNANALAQIESAIAYAITGSSIYWKLTPSANTGVNTVLQVRDNQQSGNLQVAITGTTVFAYVGNAAGGQLYNASIGTYSASTWAYIRIRFSASNVVSIDRSADGTTWVTAASNIATANWGSQVKAGVFLNPNGGTAQTATAVFPSCNSLGVSPIANLTDQFNGTSLDTNTWLGNGNVGGTFAVANGFLALTSQPTSNSYGQITSGGSGIAYTYNMVGSSVYAKIIPVTTQTNIRCEMFVQGSVNNAALGLRYLNGQMYYVVGQTTTTPVLIPGATYSATQWAYWRIRLDSAGNVFFDYSPDATTWTNALTSTTTASQFALSRLQISSLQVAPPVGAVAQTAYIDSVNLVGTGVMNQPATPNPFNDGETIGNPSAATAQTAAPTGVPDPETAGAPSLNLTVTSTPNPFSDPESIGAASVTVAYTTVPGTTADPESIGGATTTQALSAAPQPVTDPETAGAPSVAFSQAVSPNGATDMDAYDPPTALWSIEATAGTSDPESMGLPIVARYIPMPDPTSDKESIGTPDTSFQPDKLAPLSVTDIGPVGTPDLVMREFYTGYYGSGLYGAGLYGVYLIGPDGVVNPETIGAATLGDRPIVATQGGADPESIGAPAISGTSVPGGQYPVSSTDPETIGAPTIVFTGTSTLLFGQGFYGQGVYNGETVLPPAGDPVLSNYAYGYGLYGDGPYYGSTVIVPPGEDPTPVPNPTYGSGTYGYGTYPGQASAPPPDIDTGEALPLFPPVVARYPVPLHLLGIGPWNPTVIWRGAINYGIGKGKLPARPALALPNAPSKSFTLRLNANDEARAELSFARADAILVEEMITDLWWRRRDPYTGKVEMIGRFNTSHVDISRTDTGLSVSCQFENYRQILSDRLLLRYLQPNLPTPRTAWDKNTPVTEILAFVIPKNTGIDITAVTTPTAELGVIKQPFTCGPGTRVEDIMTNLSAVSVTPWEWWIETPNDVNQFPKLMFAVGQRGSDKGVVLFDYGTGPSPIASWTRRAASDQYANSIYFTGGKGGVVDVIDEEVARYGQRDISDGNSDLGGKKETILAAASKKLTDYANRQATFALTVVPGWWKGRAHVDVGDTIGININIGRELIREKYRVQEITCDVDDSGVETVSIVVGNPLPSANPRSKYHPMIRFVRKLKLYKVPPGADEDTGTTTVT